MGSERVRWIALVAAALAAALVLATLDPDAPRRGRSGADGPTQATDRQPAGPVRVEEAPVEPAAANAVEPPPRVELRTGGELLLDGRSVGLASLCRVCKGRAAVTVTVAEPVPWAHVEFVLMALQAARVRRVTFDPPGAAIVFDSDYWKEDARHVVDGHLAGLLVVGFEDLADEGFVAREAERIVRETGLRPLGRVLPGPLAPFGRVAPALAALHDAAVETAFHTYAEIDFPDEIPLPEASANDDLWWTCACRPGIAVDVPLAAHFEEDRSEEEALSIDLDGTGRLFLRGDRSLEELAAELRASKERYDVKLRAQGRSGFEEVGPGVFASKLYVRIRADRAATARQVGWILHVLAQERLYNVELAVRRPGTAAVGPCNAGRETSLTVFLPTTNIPDIVGAEPPILVVSVDRGGFGIGVARAPDAAALGRLAVGEYERLKDAPVNLVVGIRADPGVAHERVVAALAALRAAGFQKFDFLGLEPPDGATRLRKPLPR